METNGNGKRGNPSGLYRHPESGAEVFLRAHPKFGSSMADSFVAQGYKWVRAEEEAPAEVKEVKVEEPAPAEAPAKADKKEGK